MFSVSGLTADLRRRLEHRYAQVQVQGEVSNLRIQPSGHAYFTLKDARAQLGCVCFDSARRRLGFELGDGLEVIAGGQLSYYDRGGRLQLGVQTAEPAGHGALMRRFHALANKLRDLGHCDEARKRPLPPHPRAIGVVTSPQAAAWQDILRTLARRAPHIPIILSPTEVQGEGAAGRIAAALSRLDASGRVDVIILSRGGGSLEDLWAFNEPRVAKAIIDAQTPIIAGIGHERDQTIADLVTDLRASTPTAAAERAAPDAAALAGGLAAALSRAQRAIQTQLQGRALALQAARRGLGAPQALLSAPRQRLDDAQAQLQRAALGALAARRARLQMLQRRLFAQSPQQRLQQRSQRLAALRLRLAPAAQDRLRAARQRLQELQQRAERAIAQQLRAQAARLSPLPPRLRAASAAALTAQRARLERPQLQLPALAAQAQLKADQRLRHAVGRLDALSPLAVLARGYAIARLDTGAVLRRAQDAPPGTALQLSLADGRLRAQVVADPSAPPSPAGRGGGRPS